MINLYLAVCLVFLVVGGLFDAPISFIIVACVWAGGALALGKVFGK